MTKEITRWQAIYQEGLTAKGYTQDPEQVAIVNEFARIEAAMKASENISDIEKKGLFSRLLGKAQAPRENVKGLYVFGTVGRGKTFLMDMFCEHIPFTVQRLHFHHFMKNVHSELKKIKHTENPLTLIAEQFALHHRILCLDEFMVTDITDAMLLYGLFQSLIDNGVVIITTTNIPPDDLYKGGLQRERFLPAIALIKAQLVIHEIGVGQDFRRLCLARHSHFFSPITADTQCELAQIVTELSEHLAVVHQATLTINGREIPFLAQSPAVIWFQFSDLCEGYRSQLDYIEIAKQFPVIILSDIPVLDTFKEDAARRFLLLIDELYDQRIELVLSSEVPIEQIYTGKKMLFEFERLQSRLFEMQSESYIQASRRR